MKYTHPSIRLLLAVLALALLAACSSPTGTPVSLSPSITPALPTPTEMPTNTPIPSATPLPPSPTPSETPTRTPTQAPTETPTEVPTETPTETPTATPTLSGEQASLPAASKDAVWIYLIQQNVNGPICGDAAVPVSSGVSRTNDISQNVKDALKVLFSYQSEYVGGLLNPLFRSNIRVENVSFNRKNGLITVELSGTYKPTGDKCDNTRVKAQIWQTVRQFSAVKATNIYLNGIPFGDRVSND